MNGEELKNKLRMTGVNLVEIADMVGMSQANFSAALKVKDVKTGFIEKLCDVLSLDLSFFYGGTKYAPMQVSADHGSIATGGGSRIQGNTTTTTTTTNNNYGETCADSEPSPIVQTLTESVATLTRELETSQEQKSSLIKIIDKLTGK